jgi:hypothetical protein
MSSSETDPLRGKIEKAEHRLEAALGEVCEDTGVGGVRKPNTGELIRIDETLAIASAAAKQAILLRRRQDKDATKGQADEEPRPSERVK